MITITPAASERIQKLFQEEYPELNTPYLRLGVEGAGCSGMKYVFDIGEELLEGDYTFEEGGLKIVVDYISYPYVQDSRIDYEKSVMGENFTVHNPNAKMNCGCGQSFSV